jgi:hypothetical protein
VPERVLLQPAPLEYALHQEQYERLVEELEAKGVLVRVLAPLDTGGIPALSPAGEFYDLVVHVGEVAGAALSTVDLIAMVRRRLRDDGPPRTGQRRVKLYLHSGEEYEFTLDEGGEASA